MNKLDKIRKIVRTSLDLAKLRICVCQCLNIVLHVWSIICFSYLRKPNDLATSSQTAPDDFPGSADSKVEGVVFPSSLFIEMP